MEELQTRAQRRMSAAEHHIAGDVLAGSENMLASGVIYALGDLYQLSGDELFKRAAQRLVEPLLGELLDPYADPAAAALSYYRWTFADSALDEAMVEILAEMPAATDAEWVLLAPQQRLRRASGVGKRRDMLYWGEWSEDYAVRLAPQPCTAALVLAYQLGGEIDYARRALEQAASKLTMARRILRGGREHADMGGAICSVAAGHGRNWGHGAVTACYGPLLLGTRELAGAVVPLLEIAGGKLPEDVLALVRPPVGRDGDVVFFNGGAEAVDLRWRRAGDGHWQGATLAAGQQLRSALRGAAI
jgi:hypothetical protein